MKKILFLVAAFMVVAFIAGMASGSGSSLTPAERPGSPAVYAEIASQTDCVALQATFDRAEANGKAARSRRNLSLARVTTSYMEAADDRMRQINCY